MRIANLSGRAILLGPGNAGLDVEKASSGRFRADPQALYDDWDAFRDWAAAYPGDADAVIDPGELGPPVPRPRQVFALGLNYADHAAEAQVGLPESPMVFTKWPSSITGPHATVVLPAATVDWEVELVVAIGRRAYQVAEDDAWDHVAGLTVGQDLSERVLQQAGPLPQLSLGKSFPGFAPTGPWLVTPDDVPDRDDLELGCELDGEVLQHGRTRYMIFKVPELIARLSAVLPLVPGDIIFTGTPSGVGHTRVPPRFLSAGSVLTSHIEGIGELRNALVSA